MSTRFLGPRSKKACGPARKRRPEPPAGRLSQDVPIQYDWEGWKPSLERAAPSRDFVRQCGFRTLAEQIRKADPSIPTNGHLSPRRRASGAVPDRRDSARAAEPTPLPPPAIKGNYVLVNTEADFQAFLKNSSSRIALWIDLKTIDLKVPNADLVGIAI